MRSTATRRGDRPVPYRGRRGGRGARDGAGGGWWRDALAALALAAVAGVLAALYVQREHTVYFWDWSLYHDETLREAALWRALPWHGGLGDLLGAIYARLSEVRGSTGADYSRLHALPLVPVALASGGSRAAYVAGLAVLYVVPFALAVGALATELATVGRRYAFWVATLVTLLLPATWMPALNGYPDAAAAALVVLAAFFIARDRRVPGWWQPLAAGACLALAVLVRRHFAYEAVALFGAALLTAWIAPEAVRTSGPPPRRGRGSPGLGGFALGVARLLLAAAAGAVVLAVLGRPFVDRLLATDFGDLYSSYRMPAATNLAWYREFYGWAALVLAALGLAIGLRAEAVSRRTAALVGVLALWSAVQWAWGVGQLSIQYTLHLTPWVALGLTVLAVVARDALGGGAAVGGAIGLAGLSALAATTVVSLAPRGAGGDARGGPLDPRPPAPAGGLLPLRMPPAQRADLPELARLVTYLRQTAGPSAPVLVAASSFNFNDEVLGHAAAAVPGGGPAGGLNVPNLVPAVDSRDGYPLEPLLRAQYVVVALPFQHHLPPAEQGVVQSVVEALTQGWEIGQDFALLPEEFTLQGGVQLRVYRRTRPTDLRVAVHTLDQMHRVIGGRPGGQPDWLRLAEPAGAVVRVAGGALEAALPATSVPTVAGGEVEPAAPPPPPPQPRRRRRAATVVAAAPAESAPPPPPPSIDIAPDGMTLLYLGSTDSLPARVRVTGEVVPADAGCAPWTVAATALSASGVPTAVASTATASADTPTFAASVPGSGARYVVLTVRPTATPGTAVCAVTVRGVRAE